ERRYPAVYVLQGYSGFINKWSNREAFRVPYPEMVDDLFARGGTPPCIVVYVDAWTAYGGSQFVDSPGTGRYHTYLCDEIVQFVDARYRTLAGAAHRGLQGHSSGGFGALITPMLRPDLFGGLACHAGDASYEALYIPEFAKTARVLRSYDGSILAWWEDFKARTPLTRPDDMTALMVLGVTACFSAADDGTPILPFDPRTGRLIDEVWQRWLAWDPVRMIPRYAGALQGLRAVWVDGGTSDEWYLDLGAEAIRDALGAAGVGDVHFELFEGRHGGTSWRYPLSLAYLASRLQ
ncbi:MAG: hypothetical protein JO337_10265, partial [Acidimicrobiales bacterium]|nr:hypothetical protein [Acidimicrobiales bacterium]